MYVWYYPQHTICIKEYVTFNTSVAFVGGMNWHYYRNEPEFMMTSSNGNISALLAICAGNSPVPGEFTTKRPVTLSFDVFFDLRLSKRLSKQWWGWWFETLSCPLWRHCNVLKINYTSWMMITLLNYAINEKPIQLLVVMLWNYI